MFRRIRSWFFWIVAPLATILTSIVFGVRNDLGTVGNVSYLWGRTLVWSAGLKLEVKGNPPKPDRSYVYLANHLSMLDIPVILSALKGRVLCFGSDPQWFRRKFLGLAMRRAQHFPVDRKNLIAGYRGLLRAVGERGDGVRSVVIFPEGGRSRTGKLNDFKMGAFRAAVKHGRPVVPIFIDGTWESLPPHRSLMWPRPARVVVHIGEIIETAEVDEEKLESEVRQWMMNFDTAPV